MARALGPLEARLDGVQQQQRILIESLVSLGHSAGGVVPSSQRRDVAAFGSLGAPPQTSMESVLDPVTTGDLIFFKSADNDIPGFLSGDAAFQRVGIQVRIIV